LNYTKKCFCIPHRFGGVVVCGGGVVVLWWCGGVVVVWWWCGGVNFMSEFSVSIFCVNFLCDFSA
jgi:hypothetical protein